MEMFFVTDMICTMSKDLRFTDQDVPRVLTTCALYTDLTFEIKVVGSIASVTFARNAKPALGNKDRDPLVKELSRGSTNRNPGWDGPKRRRCTLNCTKRP